MKIPKVVKKTLISAGIILVVLLVAGTLYTLLVNGSSKPVPVTKQQKDVDVAPPKPPKPAANAREGVSIGAFTTPVKPGSNVSLQAHTNPTSTCKISVSYNGMASTDSGLAPKTADDYGIVDWSWTVGPNVPFGSYPVQVSCTYNGQTGVVSTSLEVNASGQS